MVEPVDPPRLLPITEPCGAQPTAYRGFRAATLGCADRTPGGTTHTGTNRGTRAAAHLSADHITQRTTKTATDRRRTITGRHRQRCEQQA